jgi:hypothetical protein
LSQQREIVALKKKLGQQPDLVSVALAVDPNESAELLKNHASKNGFDWLYALAPAAVAREIGNLYGNQFLNPPSAPMLIIDRHGQARPLPFGVKSADKLAEALQPVLAVKP